MTHIATVLLQAKESTHPDFPNRNIKGDLQAEPHALVFTSNRFNLAIPWSSIRDTNWTQEFLKGVRDAAIGLLTLGAAMPQQSFVWVQWYDEKNDLIPATYFMVYNWMGGDTYTKDKAIEVTKRIRQFKAQFTQNARGSSTIISNR